MLTIEELAREADCSHWTIRRYLKRGIVKGLKDQSGTWQIDPSAAPEIRHHLEQHGGPGGRPLIRG